MPVHPARLRPIPLFEGIQDADVEMIADHMEEREVSPGERLTREGASGYFFFVILDGTASVERQGEVLAELGPGDFFGEAAVLEATRRNAPVTATFEMTVGALFGADFAKYENDSPELHARITQVMADRKIVDASPRTRRALHPPRRHPAVERDHTAAQMGRPGGREEDRRVAHLVGRAEPLHRIRSCDARPHRLR